MKVFKYSDQILKYRFGNPIETDAVVKKGVEIENQRMDCFSVQREKGLAFHYTMEPEEVVMGLGENHRGMNKRGWVYESYCSDDPNHTPDTKSLYGAHNFLLINGRESFGVFVDYPGKVIFDIGFTNKHEMKISIEKEDVDIYIIHGDRLRDIVRAFLAVIGESYIPPKWAFGYQQCRWSYPDAEEIEKVADDFIKHDIPCDTIYMDIDYMERFKDFTVSEERFPQFQNFVSQMKEKGFRLIPIIDAGVKIEAGYDVYEEGMAHQYFCVDAEDKPFVAAVWPGRCHFPDFLNPEVRLWFGSKYKVLTDLGIEGFWNDMNEPAIFYSEKGLKEAIELAKDSEHKNLDIYSFFELKDKFNNIMNNIDDHKGFYHTLNGQKVNHYDVHNLYGYNMTRAASEGFDTIDASKRFLMFSRASYIGMHRYGGIWTGDNHSWWEHVLLNIKMMPALNMCGFLYAGADTGGFSADANSQLIIRWTQFSVFTPLFRNHSIMGSRRQEPNAFEEESLHTIRDTIRFRYALLPYLYSAYMKAAIHSDVLFAPLSFEYADHLSKHTEDQLLVGESLMIAPVYEENAIGRYVWLPEEMLLWKVQKYQERRYQVMERGHHFIELSLEEFPVFIRKNRMIVLGQHASNVEAIDPSTQTVLAFVDSKAVYTLYDDDGISKDLGKAEAAKLHIVIKKKDSGYDINVDVEGQSQVKKLNFEVVDASGDVHSSTLSI